MTRKADAMIALVVFAIVQFFMPHILASQCLTPPMNHIFSSSQEDFYCPWYRNLIRHIPLEDGLCPSSTIYRKYKNCLSDKDCPRDTYCCFSVCHGITRCYNPYTNKWAERVPESTYKSLCPPIQRIPDKTVVPATETTTVKSKPVASVSLVDEDEEPTTRPAEPKTPNPTKPPPVRKQKVVSTGKLLLVEATTEEKVLLETTPVVVTTGMPPTMTEAPTEKLTSAEDAYGQISKSHEYLVGDEDAKNSPKNRAFTFSSKNHTVGFTKTNGLRNNSHVDSKFQASGFADSDSGTSASDKAEKISANSSESEANGTAKPNNVAWSSASPSSPLAIKKSANKPNNQSSPSSTKTFSSSQQKKPLSEKVQTETEAQDTYRNEKRDSAPAAPKLTPPLKRHKDDESAGVQPAVSPDVNSETTFSKSSAMRRSTAASTATSSVISQNKNFQGSSSNSESENKNISNNQKESMQRESHESSQEEANKQQEASASEKSSGKMSTRNEIITKNRNSSSSSSSTHYSTSVQKSHSSPTKPDEQRSDSSEAKSSSGTRNSKTSGESAFNSESSSSSDSLQHFNRGFFADRSVNTWDSSKFGTQLPPFQPMTPLAPPLLKMGDQLNVNFPPMSMPGIPPLELPKLPALPNPQFPGLPRLPDLPQLPSVQELPSLSALPPLPSADPSKPRDEEKYELGVRVTIHGEPRLKKSY